MGAKLDAVQGKTYYEILNLEREATADQVKDSYKEIAKLYHPDSNFYTEIIQDPLSDEEQQIFKFITLAYTTLTHEEKRREYDKTLAPILKGWDDEGHEAKVYKEHQSSLKTQPTPQKEQVTAQKEQPDSQRPPQPKVKVVTKAPGSIDLGRLQTAIKTKSETFPKAAPPAKQQGFHRNTVMLVGIFAITIGMGAGLAVIFFLR